MSQSNRSDNPWSIIIGVAVIVLLIAGVFWALRMAFMLLYYLSPLLLIAALVIDYKVVLDYLKWVRTTFRRNALSGVIISLLSVVGFPVLSAYFLGRALLKKQVKKATTEYERRKYGDIVEYEELNTDFPPRVRKEERPINDDDLVR